MKYLGKKNFDWFETLMTFSGTTLPLIKSDVMKIKEDYMMRHPGMPKRYICYAVSKELIAKSAIKAGMAGGITSAPAVIPGLGTIGTILVGATADLAYLIKLHIELCYAISVAYDVRMDEKELKAVTLAILGFSGTTQAIKGITAGIFKKSVDEMAERYLKKGISKASVEVAERLIPRLIGKVWRFIPLLGIPIGASINALSTVTVGKQARKYFSAWDVCHNLSIDDNGCVILPLPKGTESER